MCVRLLCHLLVEHFPVVKKDRCTSVALVYLTFVSFTGLMRSLHPGDGGGRSLVRAHQIFASCTKKLLPLKVRTVCYKRYNSNNHFAGDLRARSESKKYHNCSETLVGHQPISRWDRCAR